ncbi:MAG: primosomal protein N', partial [Gammaproteobacteria bacterium]
YAPTLYCQHCGWVARCQRCDAHLVLHQSRALLRCHHCDSRRTLERQCPECGGLDLHPLGQGTERVEEALARHFPDTEIIRVDRDSTRRKGSLQALLERLQDGGRQILLGTQMIAKGHHLPGITLVGVLDADQGLFGADFRATERMAQLVLQVAGRAGRAQLAGEVLIQSRYPEHPLFAHLLRQDYPGISQMLLEERRLSQLPPFSALALLRAEAVAREAPQVFLESVAQLATPLLPKQVQLLGPVPAPMERRAGRYRAQLLLQSRHRGPLHQLLTVLVPQLGQLPQARKVRWSLDVDPQEMF